MRSSRTFAINVMTLGLNVRNMRDVVITTLTMLHLIVRNESFCLRFTYERITLRILRVNDNVPRTPFHGKRRLRNLCFHDLVLRHRLLSFDPDIR